MVMQWPAKPSTPVRFRPQPPIVNPNRCKEVQKPASYLTWRVFLLSSEMQQDALTYRHWWRYIQFFTGACTRLPLSDTAIKNAKPTNKPYKMQDEKGMYLLAHPNGGKYFRYDYRFDGMRKTLALGTYPVTSLKEARDKRDTAKKQIDGGIDPTKTKKRSSHQKPKARQIALKLLPVNGA